MKRIKILSVLLVLSLLSSCTQYILIKKDGSAHLEISNKIEGEDSEDLAEFEEFIDRYHVHKTSSLVSNFKKEKKNGIYSVQFDVSDVDSLEYFLIPLSRQEVDSTDSWFDVQMTGNTFTLVQEFDEVDSNGDFEMYGELFGYNGIIEFERKIKSFKSDFPYITQIDKHRIQVKSDMRTISYGKGKYVLEIKF